MTFWQNVLNYLQNNYLTFSISVFGLLLSLIALFRDNKLVENWTVALFGSYILVLGILLIYREYVFSRKARYAEASFFFHKTTHSIRDAFDLTEAENKEGTLLKIQAALDGFSSAISMITGASCRVCIKQILEKNEGEEYFTQTFVRSNTNRYNEKKDSPQELFKNSDFFYIVRENADMYFSNNLKKESAYNNSSWPGVSTERDAYIKAKKYDYISSISWPIQGGAPLSEESQKNKPELIGFLCIDSLTKNIFDRRYDKQLGLMFADSLYPLLWQYRNKFTLEEGEEHG